MVTHFDEEYKLTKLIKQGKACIGEDFISLANWIDETYWVKTMNIIYDTIEDKRPRLQIIFEFETDEEKFHEGPHGRLSNYDPEKQQAIAKQFRKYFQDNALIERKGIFSSFTKDKSKYKFNNLLVVYSAFKHLAMEEANSSVTREQIEELKTEIGNKEIWDIANSFGITVFFFYTNEQLKANKNNGVKGYLTDRYYKLLKQYDEFNYYDRKGYSISLDSKENFDNKYQSSWFYYFR